MSEIYERLKQIRENKEMSQAEFAKLIGVGQSTLGMMEVGKRNILERHIKSIGSICHINEKWLRTGEGEMLSQPETFSLDKYAQEHNLSKIDREVLYAYMDLDESTRRDLIDHFGKLFAAQNAAIGENEINREVEDYRRELEEEKSTQTLSASQSTGADIV